MESSHLVIVSTIVVLLATLSQTAQLPPTLKPVVLSKEPTVRIQCLSGSMIITVKDPPPSPDGKFSGMIYPKGLSKNSTCLSEYRDHEGPLRYKLPLRSCNTMPQENDDGGIEFFNTVVLQPHLKLVTDLGRGYHVRCRYKSREAATTVKYGKKASEASLKKNKQITATLNNPQALKAEGGVDRRDHGRSLDLHEDNAIEEVPMPGTHMKIFAESGQLAENVKIGDPLKIMIYIDKQEIYGLHVTDCLVRDGLGWGEQRLINSEGCPMDGEIMGQFEYTEDRTNATVRFPAHKFPYTTSVYYQCNVRLCALVDPECHQSPDCSAKRIKRQSEVKKADEEDDDGHPATIEVYSGLYVNENAEVIEGADEVLKEKTPEDAICVSQRNFAIAIAIAGLILMLAVIAAVLIIMSRRRGKAMSNSDNSDNSIYSGPYTNTAFSHGS